MISDGIENCVQYIHNFDPEKSKNPFAYFTQIIHYAFLRRIQREKRQLEIKNKIIEDLDLVKYLMITIPLTDLIFPIIIRLKTLYILKHVINESNFCCT